MSLLELYPLQHAELPRYHSERRVTQVAQRNEHVEAATLHLTALHLNGLRTTDSVYLYCEWKEEDVKLQTPATPVRTR